MMRVEKDGRTAIASKDPRAREMWDNGASLAEIRKAMGWTKGHDPCNFGYVDPNPLAECARRSGDPLRPGETPEQRVFRRYPITSHKPKF
jgi:hypothetical protein